MILTRGEQAMTEQKSELIPGAVGQLEIEIVPAGDGGEHSRFKPIFDNYLAIICHPHPLHGGSKDNKVVHTLCRAWRDMGIESIRFNFRGVGKSEGHFDHGHGELEDLKAVLAFAQAHYPERQQLILAGFSFGAFIAAQYAAENGKKNGAKDAKKSVLQNVAEQTRSLTSVGSDYFVLRQLVLVAPPVFYEGFAALEKFSAPVMVIQGRADEVVDFGLVKQWVERMASVRGNTLNFDVLEDASHFFHGRLAELKQMVQSSLRDLIS